MTRIDLIRQRIAESGVDTRLHPGEPFTLIPAEVIPSDPATDAPTATEMYRVRSSILIGEVFPALYNQLEVDFLVAQGYCSDGSPDQAHNALQLTYVPEGIQDAKVHTRALRNSLPVKATEKVLNHPSAPVAMTALFESGWSIPTIARIFSRSTTLVRRYVNETDAARAREVAAFKKHIPQVETETFFAGQGIYARDRDTEFAFLEAIGVDRLARFKETVNEYEESKGDSIRVAADQVERFDLFWCEVDDVTADDAISKTRLATELGYTTSGMRNAIATARRRQEAREERQALMSA